MMWRGVFEYGVVSGGSCAHAARDRCASAHECQKTFNRHFYIKVFVRTMTAFKFELVTKILEAKLEFKLNSMNH